MLEVGTEVWKLNKGKRIYLATSTKHRQKIKGVIVFVNQEKEYLS